MNYMKEIARMLGVELREEFKIEVGGEALDDRYKITEDGLIKENEIGTHMVLGMLLSGSVKLIKIPRKPKDGEKIWFVTTDGAVADACFHSGYTRDLSLYKLGKLYHTEAEAESHIAEDKAFWDKVRKELDR